MKTENIKVKLKIDEKELEKLRELNEQFKKSLPAACEELAKEWKKFAGDLLRATHLSRYFPRVVGAWRAATIEYHEAKALEYNGLWKHCHNIDTIENMPFCRHCFIPYQDYKKEIDKLGEKLRRD
jgi:hypothetical protein